MMLTMQTEPVKKPQIGNIHCRRQFILFKVYLLSDDGYNDTIVC